MYHTHRYIVDMTVEVLKLAFHIVSILSHQVCNTVSMFSNRFRCFCIHYCWI